MGLSDRGGVGARSVGGGPRMPECVLPAGAVVGEAGAAGETASAFALSVREAIFCLMRRPTAAAVAFSAPETEMLRPLLLLLFLFLLLLLLSPAEKDMCWLPGALFKLSVCCFDVDGVQGEEDVAEK